MEKRGRGVDPHRPTKAYDNLSDLLILFLEYPQDRVAINGNLNADNQKHLEELSRSIAA